jgi:signal transduction histidine kinase/ActR/RegA family two-component response regulator
MPSNVASQTEDHARELIELRLLSDLGAVSCTSADLQETIGKITGLISAGGYLDWCAIELVENADVPHLLRLSATDPVKAKLAEEIEREALERKWPSFFREAFAKGDPALMVEVSDDDLRSMAREQPHFELLRKLEPRSLVSAPLRVKGYQQGSIVLLRTVKGRPFDAADLRLARELAERVSLLLEQTALFQSMERAVRMRDDVLGVVAHDLRNPLGIITMAANGLSQRLTDASAHKSIARILRSAQRANRLIQDLLDISAIEAGRFSVERRQIEMADIILAAIESQQSLASAASIILASDVSPELPAIEADEERLLEVLENLVGNALKFTGAGGTITVGAASRGADVIVSVKDTGSGIAPEQLPHLFDRFWQAKKKDRRGVGLGLTICKAIVEGHGGRIWAESTVGTGTTMYFTLPATGSPDRASSPSVANILLVDDRPENLVALQAILERPDYRLVTANSGMEALRLALREHFSVMLIDVAMPGMDGLEVATHLKALERSRDIPIIFVTAFGDDPQEIHRAYAAGGADYLVKPLDAEIVRKKVAVFVDLSRRRFKTERAESV